MPTTLTNDDSTETMLDEMPEEGLAPPAPPVKLPDGITMKGLRKALQAAEDRLKPFRDRRKDNFKMYAGPYYGDESADSPADKNGGRSIVNLIAQTVDNYHAVLAPVSVTNQFQAKQGMLVGEAMKLSKAVDNIYQDESVCQEVGDPCIFDALAGGMGIAVVGLKAGSDILDVDGANYDNGKPFVEYIDPDDYIVDSSARRWSERLFEGHRYRVPIQYLKDNNLYPPDVIARMSAVGDGAAGPRTGDRVEEITKESRHEKDALLKQVELIDLILYLDDQAVDVTITAKALEGGGDDADEEPLSVRPYQGPPRGRYVRLAPLIIPSNIQPQALATVVADQHIVADRLAAKMARQMLRNKKVLAYSRAVSEDAIAVTSAGDGDSIAVDDVTQMKEMEFGGVITDFYGAIEFLFNVFNHQSGQVQQLGGSGESNSSGTATEASILQGNLQTRLSRFKEQVERFFEEISAKLAWYIVTDPMIQTPVNIRMQGGASIDLEYSAETRRGDFLDFNYNVRVSRAKKMSPEVRTQRIIELLTNVVPVVVQLALQGVVKFTETMAVILDSMDMTDLEACFNDPMMAMQTAAMMAPTLQGAGKGQPAPQQPGQAQGQPSPAGPGRPGQPPGSAQPARTAA